MALLLLILIGLAVLFGAGPWLFEKLADPFYFALQSLLLVLGISVIFHSILLPPTWFLRKLLQHLTGYEIR
jgi:hypothetical protein